MRKSLLLPLLLAPSLLARAAGFDCAKAVTPREKAICASPELSAADDQLAVAYEAALRDLPANAAASVRSDQRAWLNTVDQRCRSADTTFAACLGSAYSARVHELQKTVQRIGGVPFYWRSIHLTVPDSPEDALLDKQRGGPSYGVLDASWPQATLDTLEWRAWNQAIESAERELVGGIRGRSQPSTEWRREWASGTDNDVSASLDAVTDRLVTASLVNDWYGHGAVHGNHSLIEFNWLLKEQRELKPDDVFRIDSGWLQALYDRTDRYLHQALDKELGENYQNWQKPGQEEKAVRGVVADSRKWQIDARGLTIVFEPYAVACYACTPPPFTISWAQLRPLLQEGFEPPR